MMKAHSKNKDANIETFPSFQKSFKNDENAIHIGRYQRRPKTFQKGDKHTDISTNIDSEPTFQKSWDFSLDMTRPI